MVGTVFIFGRNVGISKNGSACLHSGLSAKNFFELYMHGCGDFSIEKKKFVGHCDSVLKPRKDCIFLNRTDGTDESI